MTTTPHPVIHPSAAIESGAPIAPNHAGEPGTVRHLGRR